MGYMKCTYANAMLVICTAYKNYTCRGLGLEARTLAQVAVSFLHVSQRNFNLSSPLQKSGLPTPAPNPMAQEPKGREGGASQNAPRSRFFFLLLVFEVEARSKTPANTRQHPQAVVIVIVTAQCGPRLLLLPPPLHLCNVVPAGCYAHSRDSAHACSYGFVYAYYSRYGWVGHI